MKKMAKRKLFLQIQSISIVYPNMDNMIVVPITKRVEIVMGIQVCLISQMNFDYEENGEKKAFPTNPKYQYHVSQCGEHDGCTNNKKNGHCYEYPSLYHFMDEL